MGVRGCVTQNPLHFVLNDISIDKPTRLKCINPYFFDVILQSKSLFSYICVFVVSPKIFELCFVIIAVNNL